MTDPPGNTDQNTAFCSFLRPGAQREDQRETPRAEEHGAGPRQGSGRDRRGKALVWAAAAAAAAKRMALDIA